LVGRSADATDRHHDTTNTATNNDHNSARDDREASATNG
jgi:hypothetical protein